MTFQKVKKPQRAVAKVKKGPIKPVDENKIIEMASKGCGAKDIAKVMGISHETITKQYQHLMHMGYALRNNSVLQRLYEKAMTGDTTALIWLTKQWCGMKDKQPDEIAGTIFNIVMSDVPRAPKPQIGIVDIEATKQKLIKMDNQGNENDQA